MFHVSVPPFSCWYIYRIVMRDVLRYLCSNNSLFAVPANQEFVYIRPQSQNGARDLVTYFMDQLHSSCQLSQSGSFSLAICVNYADLNNSMLCMRGYVSAGFFSLWRTILAR